VEAHKLANKKVKINIFMLLFLTLFSLTICGTASADSSVGGQPVVTVLNGTVSGGLYNDSYYGINGSEDHQNVTYNFKDLPSNAQVQNATLYVAVYSGNMQSDHITCANVTFNGKQIDSQTLDTHYNSPSSGGNDNTAYGGTRRDPYLIVNNHTVRVTSDYIMCYDVTSLVKQKNMAYVDTVGSYDGGIKLITLIVAYNDGDSDKIAYWVNFGQDVCDSNDSGNTTFGGLPVDDTVNSAILKVIHLASADGIYHFNSAHDSMDNILSNSSPVGSYSGSDTWDVTSMYKKGTENTLIYHRSLAYYKLVLALLTVNYTEPAVKLPDLQVSNIICNPDAIKLSGNLFSDSSNTIKATVKNLGSLDAGQFKMVLKVGNYIETKVIKGLASGASTIVSFTGFLPITNGLVTLDVTADSDGQITEANETNNMAAKSVNVVTSILPDLVPVSISVPSDLKVDTAYPVTVTVVNEGVKSSGKTRVILWATNIKTGDKVEVGSMDLDSLPVNGTKVLTFSWTPKLYTTYNLTAEVDPDGSIEELDETNNKKVDVEYVKEPGSTMIFLTSDNNGVNILDSAAREVLKQYPKIDFKIRTGTEISNMDTSELRTYLLNCDIFIGTWVTTEAYEAINATLTAYPDLINVIAGKKVFLVLEPPASTVSNAINFMNYSVIDGVKLLGNFTSDDLTAYYQNTERGTDYNQVLKYVESGTLATLIKSYEGASSDVKTSIVSQVKSIINIFNIGSNIQNLTGDNLINAVKAYLSLVTLTTSYSSAGTDERNKIAAKIQELIKNYNFNSFTDEMNACVALETLVDNYQNASTDEDKTKIVSRLENIIKDITAYTAATSDSDRANILHDFKSLIGSTGTDADAVTMMVQVRSILEDVTGMKLENLTADENLTGNVTAILKYRGVFNDYLIGAVSKYTGSTVVTDLDLPDLFDKAVLYKDLNDASRAKDMILWALSLDGFVTTYNEPPSFSSTPSYGIYRNKWYSYVDSDGVWHTGLEEYEKEYFKSGQPCVGLLESTMYVTGNGLQPYYAIIAALEAKGINVIPIVAYGGTAAQLEAMLEIFTNATSYDKFILNPSAYKVNLDAVVDMVAYGLGGTDFSEIIPFFNALNVEVVAAVHSDFETNAQYALGTSGLNALTGDKWWHIAILEDQGIVDPIFVGGKAETVDPLTGTTISSYVPYEQNIELLANKISSWTALKYLSNAAKKVALIYYNYPPGKQNIAASYLDPVQSILNLLNVLKQNGYNVQNIPSNAALLLDEMMAQGTNIASWAQGLVEILANNNGSLLDELKAYQENDTYKVDLTKLDKTELEKLANTPGVILYSADDFMKWFNQLDDLVKLDITEGPVAYIGELCKRAVALGYVDNMDSVIDSWYSQMVSLLPDNQTNVALPILTNLISELKVYVDYNSTAAYNKYLNYKKEFLAIEIKGMSGWGDFPGNVMTVVKNGIKYFVLPGIQFGNVLIAPEPQRGWEGNAEQLYHNSVVPPDYQYLAFYAYLQQQGYNAMVFVGRHATHEWLPGKEVLEDADDFTSIVTGNVPQIYFYIVDGVAEGITAKRRGSAVIIDHLTPPMGFTSLYGGMSDLESLVEDYDGADDAGKASIIIKIKETVKDNNLAADIGIDINNLSSDKIIKLINEYLEAVTNTFYPYGVDVLGQNWTDDQIALLVTSMLSVPFNVGGGNETSLQNEIALLMRGKTYDSLNAAEQNAVQEKCIEVVKELLQSDVTTVANKLTPNPTENLQTALKKAVTYCNEIKESVNNEINSFLNALNGGYITPGPANDPINNPEALPTGRNFYQDQAAEIPTKQAYQNAKDLVLATLEGSDLKDTVKKIVVGIWDVETARDNGELIAMILCLLGMEPQWTDSPSAGSGGAKLKEMPIYDELSSLVRPDGWGKKRIDVVVVIDGNFRDLYSRQLGLLDKAFRVALARSYYTLLNNATLQSKYGDKMKTALDAVLLDIGYYGLGSEPLDDNYVAYDWVDDFQYYMDEGMNCTEAGELAISRIFAPPENDYGALISQSVKQSWTWSNSAELAENYLNRMGHIYSSENWGTYSAKAFKRALTGVSKVFTSRDTNLYGILDNDDFFDYWGGLSLAITAVNGQTPDMYVLKYGSGTKPGVMGIEQFLNRELNTRYYNPQWIRGMMSSGYAGAGYMQKFVSNLWGWQVTRSSAVQNWMWDNIVDTYLKDKNNLGVTQFLENGNNAYAMISMTGTLLTAAYNGYWKTDQATLQMVANEWARMVIEHGVACCDCSCGNIAMMKWAVQYINVDMLAQFKSQLYAATQNSAFAPSSQQQTNPGESQSSQSQSGQSQSGQSSAQGSSQGQSSGSNQGQSPAGVGTSSGQSSSESGQGSSGDQGKASEVTPVSQSSSSQTGMPIAAIFGIIAIVCLVGVGYFRGKGKF
jgi:cobaltochelatase CobN